MRTASNAHGLERERAMSRVQGVTDSTGCDPAENEAELTAAIIRLRTRSRQSRHLSRVLAECVQPAGSCRGRLLSKGSATQNTASGSTQTPGPHSASSVSRPALK
jgi:hypothetical protein